LPDGTRQLRDLTAPILCRYHNNSTSDLDNEGGRFARAIESFMATNAQREWLPRVRWNLRRYILSIASVDDQGRAVDRDFGDGLGPDLLLDCVAKIVPRRSRGSRRRCLSRSAYFAITFLRAASCENYRHY
jgi:hypothetical protein